MRINVYSQELTSEVIAIEKESNTGRMYRAAQLILHSSDKLHHPPEDDDRSAVTFWFPRSAQRNRDMARAFGEIAALFNAEAARASRLAMTEADWKAENDRDWKALAEKAEARVAELAQERDAYKETAVECMTQRYEARNRAEAAEADVQKLRDALHKLLDDIDTRAAAYRNSPHAAIRQHYKNIPLSDGVLCAARAAISPAPNSGEIKTGPYTHDRGGVAMGKDEYPGSCQ